MGQVKQVLVLAAHLQYVNNKEFDYSKDNLWFSYVADFEIVQLMDSKILYLNLTKRIFHHILLENSE